MVVDVFSDLFTLKVLSTRTTFTAKLNTAAISRIITVKSESESVCLNHIPTFNLCLVGA